MRPDERTRAKLLDMQTASSEVMSFVKGKSFDDYRRDTLLRRGVERSIEIIGEACRAVPESFRAAHPNIPWLKIATQRHRIVHEYGSLDDEIVWKVATIHVPTLADALSRLLDTNQ